MKSSFNEYELIRAALFPTEQEKQEQKARIENEIQGYEKAYGLTSDEMRFKVQNGLMNSDQNICSWLMALKVRELYD